MKMESIKKKTNVKRIFRGVPRVTGIPELVKNLKSKMSAKEIDAQLQTQRAND
jgi:hypothetical protein